MSNDGPEPHTDAYWNEPRTVTQKGCAACDGEHEMDYYPAKHPPDVGAVRVGVYENPDARILAAGVCPNTETVVFVYSEGFETDWNDDDVCPCDTPQPADEDPRFCSGCRAVLPEHTDQFPHLEAPE